MNRVGVYCSMILSRALSSSRSRFGSTLAAFNSLRSVPALSNVSIYKRNQQQCRSLIYVSDTRNLKELEEANEEEFEEDETDMGSDEWPNFRKEARKPKDVRKDKVNQIRRNKSVYKVNNTAYFVWYCKSNGIKTK